MLICWQYWDAVSTDEMLVAGYLQQQQCTSWLFVIITCSSIWSACCIGLHCILTIKITVCALFLFVMTMIKTIAIVLDSLVIRST